MFISCMMMCFDFADVSLFILFLDFEFRLFHMLSIVKFYKISFGNKI